MDYRVQSTLLKNEGSGSRLDQYWNDKGFQDFYKRFRKGVALPKSFRVPNSTEIVEKKFHLKGFQFGNWATVEDRYNYLAAVYICLYDMNKVLQFKNNNLGLDGNLGIAFGARGKGRAMAHYEPWSDIINMTRYSDGRANKLARFINTGGVGAFAHEYGHFLDYFFGKHYDLDGSNVSLSAGGSVKSDIEWNKSQRLRVLMNDVLKACYLNEKGKPSAYVTRIKQTFKGKPGFTRYLLSRNEMFARTFELYIGAKLKKRGVQNLFLTETQYDPKLYLKPSEFLKVAPKMDKLLIELRLYF